MKVIPIQDSGYTHRMIERPRTHSRERAEETAHLYLENLGLRWEDLLGIKVLDIGSMSAEFEHAARSRGVDVVSLDKEIVEGENVPPKDSQFVVANATKLPFKDESFGFALAHMSVGNYIERGYKEHEYLQYLNDVFREASRILKPGGQFRLTSTALDAHDLSRGNNDVAPELKSDAYDDWCMEREYPILADVAARAGFSQLRIGKYSGQHQKRAKEQFLLTHYFIATK